MFIAESVSHREFLVDIVVKVEVQSIHGIVPSIRLSNENIAVEIEQEDGIAVQQVLVVVVHAVLQHNHHKLRVLVGMIEVVVQIFDRVRHMQHTHSRRLPILPISLNPHAGRQHQSSRFQKLAVKRSDQNGSGRSNPAALLQISALEQSALDQSASLVARSVPMEDALLPAPIVEHLACGDVDEFPDAVRNAVVQLAFVEHRGAHANEIAGSEGLRGGELRSGDIRIERKAVGATGELFLRVDTTIGER